MRRRRRVLIALLIVTMIAIAWWSVSQSSADFSPPGKLVLEKHFANYQLNIYQQNEESLFEKIRYKLPSRLASLFGGVQRHKSVSGFEILKHARRVHWQYGFDFWIAELDGGDESVGRDITGNGTPKIAVTDTFGRQGGGSLFVFECGKSFRCIATVESLGTYPKLQDLDGDGIPEVIASDNEFYHWPVTRDGEPMPEVILRWRNDKYVTARDLMHKPAPTPEEFAAQAAALRASPDWESGDVPVAIWTNALALMYGGHEDLGWKFVEDSWKPGFPGKGDMTKADIIDYYLRGKLKNSIYWRDLNGTIEQN